MERSTVEYARQKDADDPLRRFRDYFIIPTKDDLSRKTLRPSVEDGEHGEESTYLCGNSLGLQPVHTKAYMQQYLDRWATKGVYGHFKKLEDTNLPPFMDVDDDVAADMAELVGAKPSEVAVMQTLTMNLHLMFVAFYKPTKQRWKIILEGKAFPSDYYAVESQLRHRGYDPEDSMVLIEPPSKDELVLSTEHILSIIDKHASETALLLLPGIQFYTGQLFDIPRITKHAQSKGIVVGWDLAHAVGNVLVQLHDWNADFAVWCTYKYLNCGPGSIGGCFIHERHSQVSSDSEYLTRLSGWWGSSKSSRFAMTNKFEPIPGAAGFQLSNPSVADLTAVRASLDIFKQTSMEQLRQKSLELTKYLEELLHDLQTEQGKTSGSCFSLITPQDPAARGAQLSILLKPGLLDSVMESLEEAGVVVDERRPDVIRVAPAPLYNTWIDVSNFVQVFRKACDKAVHHGWSNGHSTIAEAGKDSKGWSEVK